MFTIALHFREWIYLAHYSPLNLDPKSAKHTHFDKLTTWTFLYLHSPLCNTMCLSLALRDCKHCIYRLNSCTPGWFITIENNQTPHGIIVWHDREHYWTSQFDCEFKICQELYLFTGTCVISSRNESLCVCCDKWKWGSRFHQPREIVP